MAKCSDIIKTLEKLAPLYLAESWDNVGLLVGDVSQDIHNIMVTLDVTSEIIQEAVQRGTDMIIAHHPMIFKPLKRVVEDGNIGQMVRTLIKNDIAVYAAHTNLDIAYGGLNDILASKLQLKDIEVLEITKKEKYKKIVVFVPNGYEDTVRDAMSRSGAGSIGNYSDCTYMTTGTGTFRPGDNATPFIGEQGELEKVEEYRLETIVPESKVHQVIEAMTQAHPYEEVAYDVYPLDLEGAPVGLGRIGSLNAPTLINEFIDCIKDVLNVKYIKFVGDEQRLISKIAICTGSGGDYISLCSKKGVDIYVTGEVKYHEAQMAKEAGLNVIAAGHFETENIVVPALIDYLKQNLNNQELNIYPSECDKGFFEIK